MVVDPYAALKISLLPDDLFGCDIKHVAVQFVLLLLPDVEDVVLANSSLVSTNGSRFRMSSMSSWSCQMRLIRDGLGSEHDVFEPFPLLSNSDIEYFVILAFYVSPSRPATSHPGDRCTGPELP